MLLDVVSEYFTPVLVELSIILLQFSAQGPLLVKSPPSLAGSDSANVKLIIKYVQKISRKSIISEATGEGLLKD